jgi:hypothetical protein
MNKGPHRARATYFNSIGRKKPASSGTVLLARYSRIEPRVACEASGTDVVVRTRGPAKKLNATFACNCPRNTLKIDLSVIPDGKAEEQSWILCPSESPGAAGTVGAVTAARERSEADGRPRP